MPLMKYTPAKGLVQQTGEGAPNMDHTLAPANASGVETATVAVGADELVIPVTHTIVNKTTGGDAEALTLANGKPGQVLQILLVTDGGGAGTLTPTTKTGFATIVFDDAGERATLYYVNDTVGWIILGASGVGAPPVTTV